MEQSLVIPGSGNASRVTAIGRVKTCLEKLSGDCAWKIEISKHRPSRSDQQNRYLNGVCYKLLGDAIGYERDEISEFMCGTFFGWKDKKVPKKPSNAAGIESVPVRTTTRDENGKRSVLNKQDFADFIAFVQRFGASKGVYIPDPNEDMVEAA